MRLFTLYLQRVSSFLQLPAVLARETAFDGSPPTLNLLLLIPTAVLWEKYLLESPLAAAATSNCLIFEFREAPLVLSSFLRRLVSSEDIFVKLLYS